MYEKLTRRTLWQAKCPDCGWSEERDVTAPKTIQCSNCKTWLTFDLLQYTGPDRF